MRRIHDSGLFIGIIAASLVPLVVWPSSASGSGARLEFHFDLDPERVQVSRDERTGWDTVTYAGESMFADPS
jgi:hypothetical protein